ncbi:hypothetical protein SmB9_29630 [Sphingosinicella microcystinivorans]|uniref:Uncharacterized protein n=1 Tax=Sphingosinicella microcystinivorans TaxID=335406 RepID=A0AAD1G222_SPHMI|nr:hypothetical protein SmB9_29630 [Sphingosinicella microcystinivorans]
MRSRRCSALRAPRRALIRAPRGASIRAAGGPLIGFGSVIGAGSTFAGLSCPFIEAAFQRRTFADRAVADWPCSTPLTGAFRGAWTVGNVVLFGGAARALRFAAKRRTGRATGFRWTARRTGTARGLRHCAQLDLKRTIGKPATFG